MSNQGPAAVRDSLPPLSLGQVEIAYLEGIASQNIEVARTVIELLWRHLLHALWHRLEHAREEARP